MSSRHHHNVYVNELSQDVLFETGFRWVNPKYEYLRLMLKLYGMYNPMPYEGVREMEVELAFGEGYGVWQAR
jgi:hypothetical protein